MKGFAFALGLSGLVLLPSAASAVNILVNPGFETGNLTGWTTSGFVASNAQAHTGSFSAFTNGNFWVRQDFAPIPVSQITEVSFWSLQPNRSGSFFFAWDFFYSDNTTEQAAEFGSGPTVWTKHDYTSQLDAGKSLIAIAAWGFTAGNPNVDHTFHDDFVVNVVPEPATLIAVGLGAGVLALRRRRR
jgi:hypothetical protein